MRHSNRMGKTMEDVKRVRYVERRYLKREHRRYNTTHKPISLKLFAASNVANGKEISEALSDDGAPNFLAQKMKRLCEAGTFWLAQKGSKQVRTIHPKRVKQAKSATSKIKIKDDTRINEGRR